MDDAPYWILDGHTVDDDDGLECPTCPFDSESMRETADDAMCRECMAALDDEPGDQWVVATPRGVICYRCATRREMGDSRRLLFGVPWVTCDACGGTVGETDEQSRAA